MFDRIVKGMLNEDVSSILSQTYGVDSSKARELLRQMSFSDYTDLKDAIDANDTPKVKAILHSKIAMEGNAYTAARQGTQDPMANQDQDDEMVNLAALQTGDMVSTGDGDSKISSVSMMGDKTTMQTDNGQHISISDMPDIPNAPITNRDDAMAEIERIRQLAGIEDEAMGEEIGSPTPMTCKAMSRDGSTTPNQIIKRHRKNEKPGPKTGRTR